MGCYTLESLEKVTIGLGLRALRSVSVSIDSNGGLAYLRLTFIFQCHRVHMVDDTTHLLFTRTSKEAQDVLWLLSVTNFPKLDREIHLQRYGFYNHHRQSFFLAKERIYYCWCICEPMYRCPSRGPCIGSIYTHPSRVGGIQAIILSYMVSASFLPLPLFLL